MFSNQIGQQECVGRLSQLTANTSKMRKLTSTKYGRRTDYAKNEIQLQELPGDEQQAKTSSYLENQRHIRLIEYSEHLTTHSQLLGAQSVVTSDPTLERDPEGTKGCGPT